MGDNTNNAMHINELIEHFAQKEIDHLNCVHKSGEMPVSNEVSGLKSPDKTCTFGKWLKSEDRVSAEKTIPELASMLQEIERYHDNLHSVASDIRNQLTEKANASPNESRKSDDTENAKWAESIRSCLLAEDKKGYAKTNISECELGKWLSTKQAEQVYANGSQKSKQAWDDMLISHNKLHESVKEIINAYQQGHRGLRNLLKDRLEEHRFWVAKLSQAIIDKDAPVKLETDPQKCGLGVFLDSDLAKTYISEFPAFRNFSEAIRQPHATLHQSADKIKQALAEGDIAKAEGIYKKTTLPAMAMCAKHIFKMIGTETEDCNAQDKAKKIFEEITLPLLNETLSHMETLKGEITKAPEESQPAGQMDRTRINAKLRENRELLAEATQKFCEVLQNIREEMPLSSSSTKNGVSIVSIVTVTSEEETESFLCEPG